MFDDERKQIIREPNVRYFHDSRMDHEPRTEVVEINELPPGYTGIADKYIEGFVQRKLQDPSFFGIIINLLLLYIHQYEASTRLISGRNQKKSHGSFPSAPFAGQILEKWTKPKSNGSEHAEKSKCNDELEPYMNPVQRTEGL